MRVSVKPVRIYEEGDVVRTSRGVGKVVNANCYLFEDDGSYKGQSLLVDVEELSNWFCVMSSDVTLIESQEF